MMNRSSECLITIIIILLNLLLTSQSKRCYHPASWRLSANSIDTWMVMQRKNSPSSSTATTSNRHLSCKCLNWPISCQWVPIVVDVSIYCWASKHRSMADVDLGALARLAAQGCIGADVKRVCVLWPWWCYFLPLSLSPYLSLCRVSGHSSILAVCAIYGPQRNCYCGPKLAKRPKITVPSVSTLQHFHYML